MRKAIVVTACVALVLALALPGPALAKGGKKAGCTRIQDGVLVYHDQGYPGHYLDGAPLIIGYDIYGYNYNAHMFNGSYCNAYLGRYGYPPYEGDATAYLAANSTAVDVWCWPCRDVHLVMWWSDTWLSKMDCNDDGKLDRGYSCDPDNANSSACEGAWLTNHIAGACEDEEEDGVYFVKIVDVPDDAYTQCDEYDDSTPPACILWNWYTADGTLIGSQIWGAYARIQQVYSGEGATLVSPASPGFGKW